MSIINRDNKYQRKLAKIIFSIVLILLVSIYFLFFGSGGANLSENVTRDKIRKIEIGMSEEQTIAILGQPYSLEPYSQEHLGQQSYVMVYSKPVPWARWYPMLWIHLEDNLVTEVYAKRYVLWGLDDKGVYGLTKERKWESKSFADTFPK